MADEGKKERRKGGAEANGRGLFPLVTPVVREKDAWYTASASGRGDVLRFGRTTHPEDLG